MKRIILGLVAVVALACSAAPAMAAGRFVEVRRPVAVHREVVRPVVRERVRVVHHHRVVRPRVIVPEVVVPAPVCPPAVITRTVPCY